MSDGFFRLRAGLGEKFIPRRNRSEAKISDAGSPVPIVIEKGAKQKATHVRVDFFVYNLFSPF
jgi:hypothetical protein